MKEGIKERLDIYVSSRGLRHTTQRYSIVSVIFAEEEHFTIEELLQRLKKEKIKASRATVYRTIKLLVEAGLLVEIDLGDGVNTYDPNFLESPSHNHLVCIDCGKISEFSDSHLDVLNDCIASRMGYSSIKKTLRIEACCQKLRATGACSNLIQARINGKRMPNRRVKV